MDYIIKQLICPHCGRKRAVIAETEEDFKLLFSPQTCEICGEEFELNKDTYKDDVPETPDNTETWIPTEDPLVMYDPMDSGRPLRAFMGEPHCPKCGMCPGAVKENSVEDIYAHEPIKCKGCGTEFPINKETCRMAYIPPIIIGTPDLRLWKG